VSDPSGPKDDRVLTVLLIPAGSGEESRTLRVPYRRLRTWAWAAGALAVAGTVMLGSWWYFASRSLRLGRLEEQLEAYRGDRERMETLAQQLEQLESRYEQIRGMFGSEELELASSLWLPPAGGGGSTNVAADATLPTSWPLTERGFVTQGLLVGGQTHPGVDIAVATDSYIRASGAGVVAEVGEDPTYGNYVVLDHGQGFLTRYGHASQTLVEVGRPVRQNEVIALSGSTGRSTAPHLHFEIIRDGQPLDPLEMVQQP
jgi:murein DD-endopeptidase MepM/ murein hydrolase activator NlpD